VRITVLGGGSSVRLTPLIGPDGWARYEPDKSQNRRRTALQSLWRPDTRIRRHVTPSARQLISRRNLDIDAILFTHAHADHVNGIDDHPATDYRHGGALDAYGSAQTPGYPAGTVCVCVRAVQRTAPRNLAALPDTHKKIKGVSRVGSLDIPVHFSRNTVVCRQLVSRFGPVWRNSTDANNRFPMMLQPAPKVYDSLIVRLSGEYNTAPDPQPIWSRHEWIAPVKPRRAILTHPQSPGDNEELRARLPAGVEPGFDSM